jgi:EmrB/QacA subfamily drug resistance transporter
VRVAESGGVEQDREGRRRRAIVLAVCTLSLFMVSLDATIVNVALPAIQRSFAAPVSGLQWTLDSYLLVIASLLLLSGSTGDRIGRRRMFQIGLVTFTAGSLACSLAPNLPSLVAFRGLQAVGGSMLNPNTLSIITNTFTEPRERARAVGIWSGVFGLSAASGPLLGGALVDSVGWRSVFWVNLPVGLLAFVLAARYVPESRADHPRRVDLPGQVLIIVTLASLTYAIIEGPTHGWTSTTILSLFAVAAVAGAALIAAERRRPEPLLDLRYFRSAPFCGAAGIAVFSFFVLAGFLFLNTLYLQDVRGDSALMAGLSTLPATAVVGVVSPFTGRLIARSGTRLPMAVAGACFLVCGASLVTLTVHRSFVDLALSYVALGIGFGLVNPPITTTALSGMPRAQAGVAGAVTSTARQLGNVLGVAVLGSVVTTSLRGQLASRLPAALPTAARHALAASGLGTRVPTGLPAALHRQVAAVLRVAFTEASHVGWVLCAVCGAGVLGLALLTTGAWGRASAARAARLVGGAEERELDYGSSLR